MGLGQERWSDGATAGWVQQLAFVGALRLQVCRGKLILRNGKAWRPDQTHKGVKGLKPELPESVGHVEGRDAVQVLASR